jgi:hypothetical protein
MGQTIKFGTNPLAALLALCVWGCTDDEPAAGDSSVFFSGADVEISINPSSEFHHRWSQVCGGVHQTILCIDCGNDDWRFYLEKRGFVSILSVTQTYPLPVVGEQIDPISHFRMVTPNSEVAATTGSVRLERMFSGRIEGSISVHFGEENVSCAFDLPLLSDHN